MAKARKTDPVTSHEAADRVQNHTALQKAILTVYVWAGPMTDEQLLTVWESYSPLLVSPSGLRSRRHELTVMGLVKDTGERVKTRSGRKAVVWGLA